MRQGNFCILMREHATLVTITVTTHSLKVIDTIRPACMLRHDVILGHEDKLTVTPTSVQVEVRSIPLTYT
jgi:hypothetical protein